MPAERVDGVNLGYVRDLLDQYLESPDSVDPAWRRLFEEDGNGLISEHPVVRRALELAPRENGAPAVPVETPPRSVLERPSPRPQPRRRSRT